MTDQPAKSRPWGRWLFWLVLALPGAAMLFNAWRDPDAMFELLHPSGEFSVRLMIIAMMISPLRALFGPRRWLNWLMRQRRAVGVAAFGYGAIHTMLYLVDLGALQGDWTIIAGEWMLPAILTGYVAMAIFTVMALTSNRASERALRRNWKRVQQLVYPAALLIALHWLWIDNEWQGLAVHLGPLLLLEIIRLFLWIRRRNARPSASPSPA